MTSIFLAMKKYLLLLFLSFILSCSTNNDEGIYKYEFFKNSELSISQIEGSYMKYGTISTGDNLVFKYTFIKDDEKQIADDEYAEFILFEVDSNLDSFLIEGTDLESSKAILTKSCFCYFPDGDDEKNVAPSGSISGEKIANNKWRINLDVSFYSDENRMFEATFVLK